MIPNEPLEVLNITNELATRKSLRKDMFFENRIGWEKELVN